MDKNQTGIGNVDWYENVKEYMPKDVGFEDIWEEQVTIKQDDNNEDGCSNP